SGRPACASSNRRAEGSWLTMPRLRRPPPSPPSRSMAKRRATPAPEDDVKTLYLRATPTAAIKDLQAVAIYNDVNLGPALGLLSRLHRIVVREARKPGAAGRVARTWRSEGGLAAEPEV